jgi:predicted nucleic acid-binding protein
MTIVVDASVAARWFLHMERREAALALLTSDERIIAPDFTLVELANTAWKANAFGGVPTDTITDFVKRSSQLFHELIPSSELKDRALEIALALKHPAYDCFYLALAEQRDCKLVTADDRLVRRCANTPYAGLIQPL